MGYAGDVTVKVLTFRVWAPYAHFRRPYTTRSPATFSIPPRPTVLGMIGAVLGMGKKEYPSKLADIKIGIQPEEKIRKIRTTINFVDTKESKMIQRTQMLHEFVTDPKYTIAVFSEKEELLERIYSAIKEKKPYYTPYLGTAQHIARIYSPEIEEQNRVDRTETNYVTPIDAVTGAETGKKYIVERIAYHIDAERKATKYIDVAIPVGGPITAAQTEDVVVTNGGIVLW